MTTLATLPLARMRVTPNLMATPIGTILVTSEAGSDAQRIVIRTRMVVERKVQPGLLMVQGSLSGYFVPDDECGAFVRNALDVTDVLTPVLRDILPGLRYMDNACVRGDVWHLNDESGTLFAGIAVGSAPMETAISGYARIVDGRIGEIVAARRLTYLGRLDLALAPGTPTLA
ncbi:hypothetical protein [Gluconacetobacter tumulisoli]|uniref:Uncharacterized protein n=1 Tax=Gluconacetobacter tumulisoli TaxID=1286189 RepID=A0A7W4KAI0_9PROT|nr:hypothetical protein [Gluconacetobacter tumulisoli]MBB2203354.1 hypothetical protein [Gluconacetobacter tumulisoli]